MGLEWSLGLPSKSFKDILQKNEVSNNSVTSEMSGGVVSYRALLRPEVHGVGAVGAGQGVGHFIHLQPTKIVSEDKRSNGESGEKCFK